MFIDIELQWKIVSETGPMPSIVVDDSENCPDYRCHSIGDMVVDVES